MVSDIVSPALKNESERAKAKLLADFSCIADPELRAAISDLVHAIAETERSNRNSRELQIGSN